MRRLSTSISCVMPPCRDLPEPAATASASDAGPAEASPSLRHPTTPPRAFGPPVMQPATGAGPSLLTLSPEGAASSSVSAAMASVPDGAVVPLSDGEGRYTVIGSVEGAVNRPREPLWDGPRCLADAIAHAPRSGPHLHGRVLAFPLPELFVPQILLSRADAARGWLTLAVDLRPLRLGVKAVDVRIGSTVGQLFSAGSQLFDALEDMGRLHRRLHFRINSGFACQASAFSVATETLTVEYASSSGSSDPFLEASQGTVPFAPSIFDGELPWSTIAVDPAALSSQPTASTAVISASPRRVLPGWPSRHR